jgi:hypothetical protein
MPLIDTAMRQSVPKIKFYILIEGKFLALSIELVDKLQILVVIFMSIRLGGEKKPSRTEFNLNHLSDHFAVIIQKNVLFMSGTVELLEHL